MKARRTINDKSSFIYLHFSCNWHGRQIGRAHSNPQVGGAGRAGAYLGPVGGEARHWSISSSISWPSDRFVDGRSRRYLTALSGSIDGLGVPGGRDCCVVMELYTRRVEILWRQQDSRLACEHRREAGIKKDIGLGPKAELESSSGQDGTRAGEKKKNKKGKAFGGRSMRAERKHERRTLF